MGQPASERRRAPDREGEAMTRLFIDTEFNGFGGELISLAIVSEDGEQWYGVRSIPEDVEPWVAENVIPVLHAEPIGREFFHASLRVFLEKFDRPTVYADWYTDLAHFFAAMAGKDHADSFSFPCTAVLLEDAPTPASAIPHNALADARAIRDWFFKFLAEAPEGTR